MAGLKEETRLLHADDRVPISTTDVSPPISVSTTYTNIPGQQIPYAYSRESTATRARAEAVLGDLEGGYAVTYASGMSAVFSAFVHYAPKRVLVAPGGYFVTHLVIEQFQRINGLQKLPLEAPIQKGDLVWIETPKNPNCVLEDIAHYAEKAHAAGAFLVVDATFAPPPVQYTLRFGPDLVMHSSTKYFAGHSDALGGVLVSKSQQVAEKLRFERTVVGNVPGNLESWLLLRSLRTLTIRVKQQCETAFKIAAWLESPENAPFVERVWYPGLPSHPQHAIAKKQMLLYGGMLSVELRSEKEAQMLPERLKLFRDATSLGGVESLIDWRYKWDKTVSPKLLRVSVGLEAFEDLRDDFAQGFRHVHSSL